MVFGTELKGLLASLCTNSWDSNAFLITRPEGNKSADRINYINTVASVIIVHSFFSEKSEIKTVAVCAGSGASVLCGVKADLYLTGEMSHHEVLDAACKGTHVLCDYSNTERGFLKVIQGRLVDKLATKVQVIVSEVDRDPLVVVRVLK